MSIVKLRYQTLWASKELPPRTLERSLMIRSALSEGFRQRTDIVEKLEKGRWEDYGEDFEQDY